MTEPCHPFGSVEVGGITFNWSVLGDRGRVQVLWRGQLIVDEVLQADRPGVPIELLGTPPEGVARMTGVLVWRPGPVLQVEDLVVEGVRHGGVWLWPQERLPDPPATCPPGAGPPGTCPPPIAEPAPPPQGAETIRAERGQDLFPYLFLRPWPGASREDLAQRFVTYTGPCSSGQPAAAQAGGEVLYCQLLKVVGGGGATSPRDVRKQLEALAAAFVEGEAPYQGQALSSLDDLPEAFRRLLSLDQLIRRDPLLDLAGLCRRVFETLGLKTWEELLFFVGSPEFSATVQRIWQNVFALVVLLGYEFRLLDDLLQILATAQLLSELVAIPSTFRPALTSVDVAEESSPEADQDEEARQGSPETRVVPEGEARRAGDPEAGDPEAGHPVAPWTPAIIQQRARATVILPAPVFPLPAGGDASHIRPLDKPSPIVPYAVGELQIVRQRLLGYRLGEVSRIVNVLGGERRESARRRLHRVEVTEATATLDRRQTAAAETGTDLLAATQAVLRQRANVDFSTQYGPPAQATATGSWSLTGQPGGADGGTGWATRQGVAASFGRRITTEAARRLAREVAVQRSTSTLDETEESTTSSFTAAAGQDLRGIFRWVDKVYQARAVRYGERLILEIFVARPARRFLAAALQRQGLDLAEPPTLRQLGVEGFSSISADPESPLFYGTLAARFQATEVVPPPAPAATVSATLQPGAAVTTRELPLPEGYAAARAFVELQTGAASTADAAPGPRVRGLIGRQPFSLPASEGVAAAPAIPLAGETSALPLALVYQGEQPRLSIPSDTTDGEGSGDPAPGVSFEPVAVAAEYVVNVEVECLPTARTLAEWQISTYRTLLEASRKAREEFFRVTGGNPARDPGGNPQAVRRTVQGELRRDIARQLLHLADAKVREPQEGRLGRPRYEQFFTEAFEWAEMHFTFNEEIPADDSQVPLALEPSGDGLGTPFSAFLDARSARVLLPVHPAFNFRVVFFLATGRIWTGRDDLAPAFAADEELLSLVNDLKEVRYGETEAVSDAWEVIVPTQMTVLQEGAELPSFLPDCNN